MSLEPTNEENRPQFVEIETTEELSEGQNFYDQEPFSSAIAQTVTESETDPSRLRKILTVFCGKQFSDTEDLPKDAKVLDILTNPKYNPEYAKLYSKYFEPGQSEKYRKAMAILGHLLAPYPNWYQYVRTIERAYYNQDGSMRETLPHYIPQKSYAKWLSQKPKTIGPGVTFGIEEVFPQDFAKESPAVSPNPATAAGKKPLHHVYRI